MRPPSVALAAAKAVPGCGVFVGNLPLDATESELQTFFAEKGSACSSARIVRDKVTSVSKGYAFCDFEDAASAQAAIQSLNNAEFRGQQLRLDTAERGLLQSMATSIVPAMGPPATAPRPLLMPPPGVADPKEVLAQLKRSLVPQLGGGGSLVVPPLVQRPPAALARITGMPKPIRPPAPSGPSAEFMEELKLKMKEVGGTSGKICRFGRTCKSVDCSNTHPDGRDIEDNPQSVICTFGRRCKRSNCFYVHYAGRDVDEDPTKGQCRLGAECTSPTCFYAHPESRRSVTQLRCFFCGEVGHVHKECKKDPQVWQPKVTMTNFPEDWKAEGLEALAKKIQEELEIFGVLELPPEEDGVAQPPVKVLDDGNKAEATFVDPELGKQAIKALDKEVLTMDWSSPPPNYRGKDSARDKKCTVFVGNIPFDATEEDLQEIFERAGKVCSLRLVFDKDTNKPKGYGFVDYETPEIAQEAMEKLYDTEVKGRRLRLTQAGAALGGRRDRDGADPAGEVSISGFPKRWTKTDLLDFIGTHVRTKTIEKIEMASTEDEASSGEATLQFPSYYDAKRACSDLDGQKIAGKPLTLVMKGAEQDDRGRRGGWRDDKDWKDKDWKNDDWTQDDWDDWKKDDWKKDRNDKGVLITIHLDELAMPKRPVVEPCKDDCEVWIDPLPDEENLKEFLEAFGEVDDVFRIPDISTGEPGDRGYVRFKEHDSAVRCVEKGSGTWSESERALTSQSARHGGRPSVYPESLIGKVLGHRGDVIMRVKDEIGANLLSLRGEGLGKEDPNASKRVHFVCRGSPDIVSKIQPALEQTIEKVHEELKERIASGEPPAQQQRQRSRSPRRGRNNQRNRSRSDGGRGRGRQDNEPWRPPGDGPPGPPPPLAGRRGGPRPPGTAPPPPPAAFALSPPLPLPG